jgi:hypothetical protein
MTEPNFDRQLLLAPFALQNSLISEEQLLDGFREWLGDKSRSVMDVLISDGALSASACSALESLVDLHVQKHGDTKRGLSAAHSLTPSLQQKLGDFPDEDIQNSLPLISDLSDHGDDSDSTEHLSLTLAVGDGTNAGRFKILRPHAQGGLGDVFVALDDELDREVALKQIRAKGADRPELQERFLREAEITEKLEHPGIVPVYGLGRDGHGRPYYAIRFIRGKSL